MPKYFIDTDDGQLEIEDTEGYQFTNDEEARKAAIAHLPDIAADVLPDGDFRTMKIVLRNEHGQAIYKASLSLHGEWVNDMQDGR